MLMYYSIDMFDNHTSCDDESIFICNNAECKSIAEYIVENKMFGGIVLTLINVCSRIEKRFDFFRDLKLQGL